jgi:hypothetical protein
MLRSMWIMKITIIKKNNNKKNVYIVQNDLPRIEVCLLQSTFGGKNV